MESYRNVEPGDPRTCTVRYKDGDTRGITISSSNLNFFVNEHGEFTFSNETNEWAPRYPMPSYKQPGMARWGDKEKVFTLDLKKEQE